LFEFGLEIFFQSSIGEKFFEKIAVTFLHFLDMKSNFYGTFSISFVYLHGGETTP
jgi:hypothetical protein